MLVPSIPFRKVKLLIVFVLIYFCSSCFTEVKIFSINPSDSSHYKVKASRKDGEDELVKLAARTDKEEAWIYADQYWYEVGEREGKTPFGGRSVQTKWLYIYDIGMWNKEMHHYHIHPTQDSLDKYNQLASISGTNLALSHFWKNQLIYILTPSTDDISMAFETKDRVFNVEDNWSTSVASEFGIVRIIPIDYDKKMEGLIEYEKVRNEILKLNYVPQPEAIINRLSYNDSFRLEFIRTPNSRQDFFPPSEAKPKE